MSPGIHGGDITEALSTSPSGINPEPGSSGWQRQGQRGRERAEGQGASRLGSHKHACVLSLPSLHHPTYHLY